MRCSRWASHRRTGAPNPRNRTMTTPVATQRQKAVQGCGSSSHQTRSCHYRQAPQAREEVQHVVLSSGCQTLPAYTSAAFTIARMPGANRLGEIGRQPQENRGLEEKGWISALRFPRGVGRSHGLLLGVHYSERSLLEDAYLRRWHGEALRERRLTLTDNAPNTARILAFWTHSSMVQTGQVSLL